jgi:hypothetical protein
MAPAWTIQPSSTRFDPPIQVKIPNSLNLKPGETREIYQWDHDLATFVPMGRATVTEDGAQLVTDAGSGVTKAGWGGPPNPPPDPPKCSRRNDKCPDCKKFDATPAVCSCKYDKTKIESAEVSRPFSFTVRNWGPGKALEDLIRRAFGAEIAFEASVVGQKTDKAECCDQTQGKENVLSGQAGVQGEASALFNVNGAGVVGRALYVAGLKAGVKGKVNATVQVTAEVHDCPMESLDKKENWDTQGTLGGGLELNIKVGELGNFIVAGFEGSGGVEVQGQIVTPENSSANFDIHSAFNAYVQGDVVVLNQKITGFRLQIPLIVDSRASARVLFP